MSWRPARSLTTLRDQINARFPARSKRSDGVLGDTAHSARASFHNPDANGIVRAMDITHDPGKGVDIDEFTDQLVASRDPRIHELIANGLYWSKASRRWVKYHGSNAHRLHFHITVVAPAAGGDSTTPWNLPVLSKPTLTPPVGGLGRGSTGARVTQLQTVLRAWYPALGLVIDGVYGAATEAAVRHLQERAGLGVDGVAGPLTLRKLGL